VLKDEEADETSAASQKKADVGVFGQSEWFMIHTNEPEHGGE
jgi:hypothetical protein